MIVKLVLLCSTFNRSEIMAGRLRVKAQDIALTGTNLMVEEQGLIQSHTFVHQAGQHHSTETAQNTAIQEQKTSTSAAVGHIEAPRNLELDLCTGRAAFQGTVFKGNTALSASEGVVMMAAQNRDAYQSNTLEHDSKTRQKRRDHSGEGLAHQDCVIAPGSSLRMDTPFLETSSKLGARIPGLEIAEREEFTETHHQLKDHVLETQGKAVTSYKPGFKAALMVGVSALSALVPGAGTVVGALAVTALNASASSFIQKGGLESIANHEHLDFRNMLKDVGKSLMVQGLNQVGGNLGVLGNVARGAAAQTVVHGGAPLKTLASQGVREIAKLGAEQIGGAYQKNTVDCVSHKLLHGALAMASTFGNQALQSGEINWDAAFLAAGSTLSAEVAAEGLQEIIKENLPKPEQDETREAYLQRCQAFGKDWGTRSVACLRVLSATSLALAGQEAEAINACDVSITNGLEHNALNLIAVGVTAAAVALWGAGEFVDGLEPEQRKALEEKAIVLLKETDFNGLSKMIDDGLLIAEQADADPMSRSGIFAGRICIKGALYGISKVCNALAALHNGGLEGLGHYLSPFGESGRVLQQRLTTRMDRYVDEAQAEHRALKREGAAGQSQGQIQGSIQELRRLPAAEGTYGEFSVGRYKDLEGRVTGLDAHHMLADAALQQRFSDASNFRFPYGGNIAELMRGVNDKDLLNAGTAVLLDKPKHRAVHNYLRKEVYRQPVAPSNLTTREVAAREHSAMRTVGTEQGWYNPAAQLGILHSQKEGVYFNDYVVFPVAEGSEILAMPFSNYQAMHQAGTLSQEIRGATGYWVDQVERRSRTLSRPDPAPNPPGSRSRNGRKNTKQETQEERERSLSPEKKED